jgi:hypothetical protein
MIAKKFKDFPKLDFFPFQNFNNPYIHNLDLFILILLLLYSNNLIQLYIYSSHPPQNPICFPKEKKTLIGSMENV